jgi:hypothetical protein
MDMHKLLIVTAVALLAACGDDGSTTGGAPSRDAVKLDAFCTMPGLKPALRETVLVIDRNSVKPSKPENFKTENADLFAAVIGLADAERAVGSGAMTPREHLTIAVANAQNGGLNPIFSGCLPAMSKEELADRRSKGEDGMADAYFGSDMASKLEEARSNFMTKAVLMVAQVAGDGAVKVGDNFNSSGFARTFKIIGPGADAADRIRRLIVFADPGGAFATVPDDYAQARKAGFEQAQTSQTNLGMSELYLVPSGRTIGDAHRAFLDAWFLSSGADLRHVGAFTPDSLAKAPVRIAHYTGQLPLSPEVMSPMELRLPAAADGSLVSAWISYTGSKGIRRTPIAGQFACSSDGCELIGDPEGSLGQRWRTEPGMQPQPLVDGPFGGMRLISGKDDGQTLKARIYDPIIYVGDTGDISFTAKRSN